MTIQDKGAVPLTCSFRPCILVSETHHPFLGAAGVFANALERIARDGFYGAAGIAAVPDGGERRQIADIVTADVDGDGRRELLSIAPLHGSIFAIHKKVSAGGWREVYSSELDFGHVVWGGKLLGKPAIIVGSRGGNKALTLLRPHPGRVWQMETTVVDEGVGPNQIAVVQVSGKTQILSANHGAGEVALCDLTGK